MMMPLRRVVCFRRKYAENESVSKRCKTPCYLQETELNGIQ